MTTDRIKLFGYEIDSVDMSQAVEHILRWTTERQRCRVVVTPNVDHMVMLQSHQELAEVYHHADLILADGWPVVLASKLLGKPLPERVAGSDLVPALFSTARSSNHPLRVFLLGAAQGVAECAAIRVHALWPNVRVVGTYSPPIGFEKSGAENVRILQMIAQAEPDVLVVGLGAPKQELWVHKHRTAIRANAALCVGATIDFLAGEKKRAPEWVQAANCEWLYRLCSEPRRLWKRYAHDAVVFPQLFAKEWIRGSATSNS